MCKIKMLLTLSIAALLVGCGGEGEVLPEGGSRDDSVEPISDNTFFPLNFYMQGGAEYDVINGYFKGLGFNPYIQGHLMAPVNARTLEAAKNPSLSDYEVTIAGSPLVSEHAATFQKVVGLPVQLRTALIIDTSASMSEVTKSNLIAEIKNYISKVKTHPNSIIRNQQFTLWGFGSNVVSLINDFEDDQNTIETALDNINWNAQGNYSSVYHAIVAAVGSYKGNGSFNQSPIPPANEAYDFTNDGDNDLVDGYVSNATKLNGLYLSSIVLFSNGGNSLGGFDREAAKAALNWQSFVVFNKNTDEDGEDSPFEDTTLLSKALYYVSIGSSVDADISGLSTSVIPTNSTETFLFSNTLIAQQLEGVNARARTDNLYMLRFPIPYRYGQFDTVVKSNTGIRDMTLTTAMGTSDYPWDDSIPEASSVMEISGPNDEYIVGSSLSLTKAREYFGLSTTADVRLMGKVLWDASRNHPATNNVWAGGGTSSVDGSITLTNADVGRTITVTNGAILASLDIVN